MIRKRQRNTYIFEMNEIFPTGRKSAEAFSIPLNEIQKR